MPYAVFGLLCKDERVFVTTTNIELYGNSTTDKSWALSRELYTFDDRRNNSSPILSFKRADSTRKLVSIFFLTCTKSSRIFRLATWILSPYVFCNFVDTIDRNLLTSSLIHYIFRIIASKSAQTLARSSRTDNNHSVRDETFFINIFLRKPDTAIDS